MNVRPSSHAKDTMPAEQTAKRRGAAIGLLMGITAGLGLAAAVAAWVHHQPAPKMQNTVLNGGAAEQERQRQAGWNPNESPILGYQPRDSRAQARQLETNLSRHASSYPQARAYNTERHISSMRNGILELDDEFGAVDNSYPGADELHPWDHEKQGL